MATPKTIALCLTLTFIYFVAAKFGLYFAFEQANASPVWPPTGFAIAAMLYFGYRVWPAFILAPFLINYYTGTSMLASLFIGAGNLLETLVATGLILRFISRYPFDSVKSTLGFVFIILGATTLSATIGVSSLLVLDVIEKPSFLLLWTTWWLGHAVSGLVITPFLLTLVLKPRFELNPLRLYESIAIFFWSLLSAYVVFSNGDNIPHAQYSQSYLLVPTIIWAALRFYQLGATGIISFYTAIAIYCTTNGSGPFVTQNVNESLLILQSFMAIITITALALAASVDETQKAQIELNTAHDNLEQQVLDRTKELSDINVELKTQINHRQQATDSMQSLLNAANLPSDEQYFHEVTKELAQIYDCRFAFIGVFADSKHSSIRTLSIVAGGQHVDNFTYTLANTPCQDVLDHKMELVPHDAAKLYAKDELLAQMGIESYFATPIVSPTNTIIGIMVVMDTKPMTLADWVKPVLGLMSNRVGYEVERNKSKQELKLAASVFKETVEAIIISDSQKRILRVNPAFTTMTGYNAKGAVGELPLLLESNKHSEGFYDALWHSTDKTGTWQGEIWHTRKNGDVFPCWQTITVVKDQQDNIKQYITVFSDITNKKQAEKQIYHLAHFDVLTGLPNRSLFIEQLDQSLENAKVENLSLGLLFMDLDHFKLVNDSSGHSSGDILLIQVADRLRKLITENVIISRFGGDEFTVLIKNIDSYKDIEPIARAISTALIPPFYLDCAEVVVSASIGYCTYPQDAVTAHELLKNADIAMYKAKEDGRKNIKRFTPQMNLKAKQRVEIEQELRIALKQNQFVLHYQPQVQLSSGKITGCEALVRWNHPQKGMVPPDYFIPIAEESGLIVPLGDWVLEAACRQFMQWQTQGVELDLIAVNLSARQFINHDLVTAVQQILKRTGMNPVNLELELTESMLMENVDLTIGIMQKLKGLNIQLAIDDFGTGYASLAYLKHFPIDKLKIDKSFIDDLLSSAQDAAIVNATINLAHGLGLTVIAEGVEHEAQCDYLTDQKCEEIQGYYFCRPLPANSPALMQLLQVKGIMG